MNTTPLLSSGEQASCRSSLRDLWPAAVLFVAGLLWLVTASVSAAPTSGQYVVIAAPWSDLGRTINLIGEAGGGMLEAGRFENIAFAASTRPDFADAAREAGAWFVFPASQLLGCIGETVRGQRV